MGCDQVNLLVRIDHFQVFGARPLSFLFFSQLGVKRLGGHERLAGFLKQNRIVSGLSRDRKSTRLNSSHSTISYAVFCLKKTKREKAAKRPPSPMRTMRATLPRAWRKTRQASSLVCPTAGWARSSVKGSARKSKPSGTPG